MDEQQGSTLAKDKKIKIRIWSIAGALVLFGCVFVSVRPLLQSHAGVGNTLVILGTLFVVIPLFGILVFGRRWNLWPDHANTSTQVPQKLRLIWWIIGAAVALGCVALSVYPLFDSHSKLRGVFLILGLQLLLIPLLGIIFLGRRCELWEDDRGDETDAERDVRWTRSALLNFAFFGLFALGLFSASAVSPFAWFSLIRVLGVGFLYAAAFFAAGALFGFLFGIPRSPSNQNKKNADSNNPTRDSGSHVRGQGYTANTNLEDISDWLTKIIVGLGLINLKAIPEKLQEIAAFFASFCGNESCEPVALALIIYFFVCGFFLGYLMTRLYLTGAFGRADVETVKGASEDSSSGDSIQLRPIPLPSTLEVQSTRTGATGPTEPNSNTTIDLGAFGGDSVE